MPWYTHQCVPPVRDPIHYQGVQIQEKYIALHLHLHPENQTYMHLSKQINAQGRCAKVCGTDD